MTAPTRADATELRSLDLGTLFRCYGYLKPYTWYVVGAAVALAVIDAAMLLIPQIVRLIVDRGIRGGDVGWLPIGVAGLLGLVLIKGLLTFVQGRLVERASQGVAYSLRRKIHKRLTALSFSFHDQSESGQLLSRSIQDVERIRFLTGRASLRLIEGSVFLVTTAAVLFIMSPRLAHREGVHAGVAAAADGTRQPGPVSGFRHAA